MTDEQNDIEVNPVRDVSFEGGILREMIDVVDDDILLSSLLSNLLTRIERLESRD